MRKTKLFQASMRADNIRSFIFDRWFDWKCKQEGAERTKDGGWLDVIGKMPNHFDWNPWTEDRTMMEITWDGGKELVPLTVFYDDHEDQPDLRMLWHEGYWDGPLDGVAELDGEMVYFDMAKDEDYDEEDYEDMGDYRRYRVFRMTEEEKAFKIKRHHEFQTHVGYHCDYGDVYLDYKADEKPKWLPKKMWRMWREILFRKFYWWTVDSRKRESKRILKNLTDESKLIGVFDECQFKRGKRGNRDV